MNLTTRNECYNLECAPECCLARSCYYLQQSGRYKLCLGKSSREECQCTDEMKVSTNVNHSDCRERVGLCQGTGYTGLN